LKEGEVNMSKWAEIRNDYYDEKEECYTIDAWLSANDNEEGKTIAKVFADKNKGTMYLDTEARTDKYAQEMIDDRIMILENYDPRVNYINS
jgi:acyl-CoA synthetase (AMP-forming)/AMP-acid ligase II